MINFAWFSVNKDNVVFEVKSSYLIKSTLSGRFEKSVNSLFVVISFSVINNFVINRQSLLFYLLRILFFYIRMLIVEIFQNIFFQLICMTNSYVGFSILLESTFGQVNLVISELKFLKNNSDDICGANGLTSIQVVWIVFFLISSVISLLFFTNVDNSLFNFIKSETAVLNSNFSRWLVIDSIV